MQIGNPLLKLDVDAAASWEYLWSHGLISEETNDAIMNHCNFDDYVMSDDAHNVSQECTVAMEQGNQELGDYVNQYDVILDFCYPSLVEQELRLKRKVPVFFQFNVITSLLS